MSINISFGSGNTGEGRKPLHKKPWFWLLIILIASTAFKLTTRSQPRLPLLSGDKEGQPTEFSFQPEVDLQMKNESVEESVSDELNDEEKLLENGTAENNDTVIEKSKSVFHFILNTATKKYHTKECSAAKKLADEKRMDTDVEADSLDEAKNIIEADGYELCGLCDR